MLQNLDLEELLTDSKSLLIEHLGNHHHVICFGSASFNANYFVVVGLEVK